MLFKTNCKLNNLFNEYDIFLKQLLIIKSFSKKLFVFLLTKFLKNKYSFFQVGSPNLKLIHFHTYQYHIYDHLLNHYEQHQYVSLAVHFVHKHSHIDHI